VIPELIDAFRRRLRPPLQVLSCQEIERAVGRLSAAPIPRVVHQIWLGPKRPPLETMESCRQANPGWLHVLWTEDNLPPLRNRVAFDALGTAYHGKADVLRYELLHRFGGVYVDADQLCLRGFDDLLGPGVSFFAGYQNLGNPELDDERRRTALVANGVLGASPRHPVLERVIRDIGQSRADERRPPWLSVGPAALTRAIEETPSRAVVHPFHEFYPYHFTEDIPANPDDMLKAIHYRSHSVSLWGTTLGRYGTFRRLLGLKPGGVSGKRAVPPGFVERHPRLPATVLHA
jgi:hypothetical protein